jgi:hypothetical protein
MANPENMDSSEYIDWLMNHMTDFPKKRFVDLGQAVFQDLVKGYHSTLHSPDDVGNGDGYGEVEDHTLPYRWFAEMSFAAVEEFAKVFRYQED